MRLFLKDQERVQKPSMKHMGVFDVKSGQVGRFGTGVYLGKAVVGGTFSWRAEVENMDSGMERRGPNRPTSPWPT
jgi:hypothetical protein